MIETPVLERARVRSSGRAGPYVVLGVEAPEIARRARPGQFVNLAQSAPGHLLRRPFSIFGVRGDVVLVAFDVVGAGTEWLAARGEGDPVEAAGPLGSWFTPPQPGTTALLVGGGYGAAPLFYFAETLRAAGIATRMILGAATASRLFDPARAAELVDTLIVATEDGSAGVRGRVTDAMDGAGGEAVYACGPMPMLAAVAAAAGGRACEVAVEEFMACGIGVCWTCVVPTHEDGYRRYLRSCTDGPVFDGSALAWA